MSKVVDIIKSEKKRVFTGVALILCVVFIGYVDWFPLVWGVLGGLYLLGFSESMKLFDIKNDSLYFYAGALWLGAYISPDPLKIVFIALIILGGFLAYKPSESSKFFIPFIYPTIGFLALLSLYKEQGIGVLLWLIIVVAATDIGAYFFGKTFGKTKFSQTSPNKTLEGVLGGVLAGTLLGGFFGAIYVDFFFAFFVSLLTGVASVFGDLFESYLKREAGVKDSGTILPGHGGVLDRLDGYLFAVIVMIYFL